MATYLAQLQHLLEQFALLLIFIEERFALLNELLVELAFPPLVFPVFRFALPHVFSFHLVFPQFIFVAERFALPQVFLVELAFRI